MSLISPNALPRKGKASGWNKRIVKRSYLKHPPFEGVQQILSSPPRLNQKEYSRLKNEVICSTSQSCTNLMKVMFHCKVLLESYK